MGNFITRHLLVPASPSHLRQVRRYVEDAAADFGLGPGDRHALVFAVNEAVTNAIKHGSPFRNATISLRIEFHGDTLICCVADNGRFVPAPADSGTLAEGGRGLKLMALFTDELELFTEAAGTTVRLHKRRASAGSYADNRSVTGLCATA